MKSRARNAVAVLLLVALPLNAALSVAGQARPGTVDCCCGPHDAHASCHCPDCPVASALAVEESARSGDPDAWIARMAGCGPQLPTGLAFPGVHWWLPPPRPWLPPRRAVAAEAPGVQRLVSRVVAPEPPPS